MRNVGYIYQITICTTGDLYIGATALGVKLRVRQHLTDSRRHLHYSLLNNKFKVRTLKTIRYTKISELFRLERFFINKLKPKLNRR